MIILKTRLKKKLMLILPITYWKLTTVSLRFKNLSTANYESNFMSVQYYTLSKSFKR